MTERPVSHRVVTAFGDPPPAPIIRARDPAFIDVHHQLLWRVDLKHLLRVQWPQYHILLWVACRGHSLDLTEAQMISQLHEPQHCLSRNLNTRVTLDLIDDLLGWPYGLLIAQSALYCCSYELELFESSKFRLPLADKERLWSPQIPHQITYQLLLDVELDSQLIVRELPSSSSLHDAQSLSASKSTECTPLTSHVANAINIHLWSLLRCQSNWLLRMYLLSTNQISLFMHLLSDKWVKNNLV